MASQSAISYSIIIETDNLPTISWDEFEVPLTQLLEQINDASRAGYSANPEIIFVAKGDSDEARLLLDAVRKSVPQIEALATLQAVGVPDGRYYMLKNAGAEAASNELLVFLDSDITIEAEWLEKLLSPFQDSAAMVSLGCTCLAYTDWISRCLSLIWVFPLRCGDEHKVENRPIIVNNCAFRRSFFLRNRFVENNGFKVDCAILMRSLLDQRITIHRPPAFVRHAPLRGWRFLIWRAQVTGRDGDRKYELMKHPDRARRILHAIRRSFTHSVRVPNRIITRFQYVGLKPWQIPQALLLGWAFYGIAAFEQLRRALGMTLDQPERIPDWVEHS